jgi:CubicO group peptidase (beta-lactamase class C family)
MQLPYQPTAKIIRLFILPCLLFINSSAPCQQKSITLSTKIEQLLNAYVNTGLFNGSVLISHHGKILTNKGYGFSDPGKNIPNTTRTRFPVYSITKPMTATLVLQLSEKRLLQLNDPIARFFPGIPGADSITIEHLLTHTLGLYAYNNDFSMPVNSEDAIIAFLSAKKLRFQPGSQWEYCNTGYYLLGFIIEKLTGLSFEQSLYRSILIPSQMKNSGMNFRDAVFRNKATGHQFFYPDSFKTANLYADDELRSAGGVWSTTKDLYKFHLALQQYQLISARITEEAYTPYKKQYGYGWFIDSLSGHRIISHSGGAAGFRSYLVRIPEINSCIILLANAENIDLTPLKDQLLRVLLNKPYQIPVNEPVDNDTLSSIAGVYQLEPERFLYITRLHHRLIAQISGQQPALLLADKYQRFFVSGMDGHLEFHINQADGNESVFLYRKNRKHTGYRITPQWGITGSALPGGWNAKDIKLYEQTETRGYWTSDTIRVNDGVIKFRYNNDWTINLGNGKDSSLLVYDGSNIPIKAGTYIFRLDLTTPDKRCLEIEAIVFK